MVDCLYSTQQSPLVDERVTPCMKVNVILLGFSKDTAHFVTYSTLTVILYYWWAYRIQSMLC